MIDEKVSDKIETSFAGFAFVILGYFVAFNFFYNSFLFFYELIYSYEYVSLRGSNDFDFASSLTKLIVTFILVICICIFNKNNSRHIFGFEVVSLKCLALCVGCVLLYFSLYGFLRDISGDATMSRYFVDSRSLENDTYKTFVAFLFVCLVTPACEEVFFRGYLMRYLLDSIASKHLCVIFSSFLFSSFHYDYSPIFLVEVFIISSMIGYARVISKSIYPCIVMHVVYNSTFFIQL